MRRAAAILFSILLILGHIVVPGSAFSNVRQYGNPACDCGKPCCLGKSDAASEPLRAALPSAPADELQSGYAFTAQVIYEVAGVVAPDPSSSTFSPSPSAVPVFKRNCVFLI